MMKRILNISVLISISCLTAFSQVERLRIETYYIADENDATDTLGGELEAGSITFRIYADLLPETKILAIYGETNHPLVFSSTAPFFNHREEGITFGKDLSRNRFETGTVPLDSYITLGQCSRSFAQGAYFGVPKELDTDGSVIGGVNNDGGSASIATGLLTNERSEMGFPLTVADGLSILTELPDAWLDVGFIDLFSNSDTTIFGADSPKYSFNREDVVLRNSGVTGVDPIQNEVLLAQLTTKGEITFEINLEVETGNNGTSQVVKYVAKNESLEENEIYAPFLKYPYTCGCKDPAYLEASTSYACEDNSQCQTLIVFGCTDSLACNYEPSANFNITDLCCYVGYCNDLDISIVCPDLQPRAGNGQILVDVFPNPATTDLYLKVDHVEKNDIRYTIYDMFGRSIKQGILKNQERYVDISGFTPGCYILHSEINKTTVATSFVKM